MFAPFSPNISFVVKSSNINTLDEFISMSKNYSFLTLLNILSCSISESEPFNNVLKTIDVCNTTKDFVISNIVWNKHFNIHDEICWTQLMINHRLKKMNSYMYNYTQPMFICNIDDLYIFVLSYNTIQDLSIKLKCPPYLSSSPNSYSKFKHNPELLEFVLENVKDDCFNLMNFLVRHYNISTDWDTLSKYVRSDDILVITNNDFQFNVRPYLSFKKNVITVYLPSYIIWSNDVSIINLTLENDLGFIPSILYKAIKDDHIIIIFEPFKSNKLDTYTKNMIRIFHKLN
jgi:hypothetical protein